MSPTGRISNSRPEIQDLNWGRRKTNRATMPEMDFSEIEFRMMELNPPTVMRAETASSMLIEYRRLTKVIEYNQSGRHPLHKNREVIRSVVRNLERKRQRLVDQFPTLPEWHEKREVEFR